MKIKLLAKGISTFVPRLAHYRAKGTGGTDSARYCYTVWARHAIMAAANRLDPWPAVIAELGPGDSLGIGLAALVSGCERYLAFDVVEHASTEGNLKVFDELVELFRSRADIPGDDEFPRVLPRLSDYRFPSRIFTTPRLATAMATSRLEAIRASIVVPGRAESMIDTRFHGRARTSSSGRLRTSSTRRRCSSTSTTSTARRSVATSL